MLDVQIMSKMHKLLKLLINYKKCFNFKNAKKFFKHENKNHIIDLIFDVKSLYESLYTFFQTELNILKN